MKVAGPQHVATIPSANTDPWWTERHAEKLATTTQGGFRVAFIGDSITQGWEEPGRAAWDRHFAAYPSANFGFSGDRTEQALYRLLDGEILPANPELVVVLLGTNNVGHGSSEPAQAIDGLNALLDLILEQTGAKVLLMAVLPRSEHPADLLRRQVKEISRGMEPRASERVAIRDYGGLFVSEDGTLKLELMPDALHLTPEAYDLWAVALARDIASLLS